MHVVAFNGSMRVKGNTEILLRTVLSELEGEGISTELIPLAGQNISGCRACYQCHEMKNGRCVIADDPINDYIVKMRAADGIILGSPTYFSDITAAMKAFIERTGMVSRSAEGLFARKVGAGVVAVRRAGAMHAFNSLNLFFLISQMIVVGSSYWNIGIGRQPGDVEKDAEGIQTMKTLGRNMAWLLKRIQT